MFLKICHLDIILLAILSASKITTAEDYASSEEVTTTSIDFFDSENTNEFFDPLQQSDKNYQDISDHKSHEADVINYNKFTSDEEITQKNVLTTMVPDYIQMFSDMMINGEESYLKENDSRSSETATNETLSSTYPIKNSIYSDKDLDIIKNISEDNHMMDSQDDEDIDQLEAGTTTLMTPTVRTKQGKQIQIIKLLPHEALRNYIEDAYIRTPLAAVVDTSSYSLEKTKTLWKDALRPNAALDIVLLAFNASGVSVTYHFQNTRTFLAGLESIKEESTGNAFYGIIRASELIPYDSAVFVSTATAPTGANLAQYAAITLLKKRIRLYLIWFGEKTFSENETQEVTGGILGEVAIRSGGEILHIGNDSSKDLDENMLTVVSENYHGPQQIEIPVETTMSSLHIKIDSMMRAATLETPNGEIRLKSLRKFSVLQFNDKKVDKLDVSIPLAKFTQPTKFFLKVIPEDEAKPFWVVVKAMKRKTRMEFGKEVFDNTLQAMNLVEIFNLNNKKLTTGKRDEHNKLEKIRFPSDNDDETELIENDINSNNNITTTNAKQIGVLQGITKIDVGIQSQLLVAPGMMAQIYFEVTNLRSEPVYHSIQVRDEQRYLTDLSPQSLWLPAGQTGTATLTVRVPPEAVQGTRDKITFVCQGYGRASQSLELKVVSVSDTQDTTPPRLSWTFGSRCDGNFASNSCTERIWSLEITAQDWETGILRVQSTPQGITSRIPFTVGTSEPARVTYTSTCCQPRVSISAYDLAGNQRTADIDVRDIILTDASIAAIVLGALLLILLIILFICLIVWCCKRRKESRDLPSFRSNPERR